MILNLLVASVFAQGQASVLEGDLPSAAEMEAVCKRMLCREYDTMKATLQNGQVYEYTPPPSPIVWGERVVSIRPEEKLFVEAAIEGTKLVNLRAVKSPLNPVVTLTFRMWQEKSTNSTFLVVTNPLTQSFTFKAGFSGTDEKQKTLNSCPVPPNGASTTEHFQSSIDELNLYDFIILADSTEPHSCDH